MEEPKELSLKSEHLNVRSEKRWQLTRHESDNIFTLVDAMRVPLPAFWFQHWKACAGFLKVFS